MDYSTITRLIDYAKKYRNVSQQSVLRNKHMNDLSGNEEISQEVIDAILVDFINFIGMCYCRDIGLYTVDLKPIEKKNDE